MFRGKLKKAEKLWKDKKGQSSIEYILILAIVVLIVAKFRGAIVNKIDQLTGKVTDKIEKEIEADL